MIILSAGIQKSGTGWFFNMTNDLLVAAGKQDVRAVRDRYGLSRILKHENCNLGLPRFLKLVRLLHPHMAGNTFVVKTHTAPTGGLRLFVRTFNVFKVTFIYRDPRDIALSAFDHGQKIRSQGESHTFGRLDTIEKAITETRRWVETWDDWHDLRHIHLVRYETLKQTPAQELRRLVDYLGIEVPADVIEQVAQNYQPDQLKAGRGKSLHFNKGQVGRFRQVMTPQQIELSHEVLGEYVQKMGYEQ